MAVAFPFIVGEEDAYLTLFSEELRVDVPSQSELLPSFVDRLKGRSEAERLINRYDTYSRHEGIVEGSLVLLHRRLDIGSIAH